MGGVWALLYPYFQGLTMLVSPSYVLGVMALARVTFGWGNIRQISEGYGIQGGQDCSY